MSTNQWSSQNLRWVTWDGRCRPHLHLQYNPDERAVWLPIHPENAKRVDMTFFWWSNKVLLFLSVKHEAARLHVRGAGVIPQSEDCYHLIETHKFETEHFALKEKTIEKDSHMDCQKRPKNCLVMNSIPRLACDAGCFYRFTRHNHLSASGNHWRVWYSFVLYETAVFCKRAEFVNLTERIHHDWRTEQRSRVSSIDLYTTYLLLKESPWT